MKHTSKLLLTTILSLFIAVILYLILNFNKKESSFLNTKVNISTPKTTDSKIENKLFISGWIPNWREADAIESLKLINDSQLKEAMPVWYKLTEKGQLDTQFGKHKKELTTELLNKKVNIIPTMNNISQNGFDPDRVSLMLNNREVIIKQILDEVIENNYSGWDLDLEEINANDSEEYVNFIEDLTLELNKFGKKLSVTLHSQDGKNRWSGTDGQDIEKIGLVANEIKIMVYDFHNNTTLPGPITPDKDLRNVIKYTISKVDKEKVAICLPTYGYKWSKENVEPLQFIDIFKILSYQKLSPKREEMSGELMVKYVDKGMSNTIWYQDGQSINTKIDRVKESGINNICLWNIGGEDPSFWTNLKLD